MQIRCRSLIYNVMRHLKLWLLFWHGTVNYFCYCTNPQLYYALPTHFHPGYKCVTSADAEKRCPDCPSPPFPGLSLNSLHKPSWDMWGCSMSRVSVLLKPNPNHHHHPTEQPYPKHTPHHPSLPPENYPKPHNISLDWVLHKIVATIKPGWKNGKLLALKTLGMKALFPYWSK